MEKKCEKMELYHELLMGASHIPAIYKKENRYMHRQKFKTKCLHVCSLNVNGETEHHFYKFICIERSA